MSKSVIPLQQGFDYQAAHFWGEATMLFEPLSQIEEVWFEDHEVPGFDDVGVMRRVPASDGQGGTFGAKHMQIKYHSTYDTAVSAAALMRPAFIGGTRRSALQRLLEAYHAVGEARYEQSLFYLLSPCTFSRDDPLAKLVRVQDGALRWTELQAAGPVSAIGKIRTEWSAHLDLGPDELCRLLARFRLIINPWTSEAYLQHIASYMRLAGWRVPEGPARVQPLLTLVRQLHGEGTTRFTRASLTEILNAEFGPRTEVRTTGDRRRSVGVRSFMRWAESMEDQVEAFLGLEGYFDGRRILSPASWNDSLGPAVSRFATETFLNPDVTYEVRLDCHSSVAFSLGYELDPKSGVRAVVVQKSLAHGIQLWDEVPSRDPAVPLWEDEWFELGGSKDSVAVVLNVTHNATPDVRRYLEEHPGLASQLAVLTVLPGPGSGAVRDGSHNAALADAALRIVAGGSAGLGGRTVHLFVAAPNAFVFRLGRLGRLARAWQLYEFDFGSSVNYEPSVYLTRTMSTSNAEEP